MIEITEQDHNVVGTKDTRPIWKVCTTGWSSAWPCSLRSRPFQARSSRKVANSSKQKAKRSEVLVHIPAPWLSWSVSQTAAWSDQFAQVSSVRKISSMKSDLICTARRMFWYQDLLAIRFEDLSLPPQTCCAGIPEGHPDQASKRSNWSRIRSASMPYMIT